MRNLAVWIEQNGTPVLVGELFGGDAKDTRFSYDAAYLQKNGSTPVSVSLPFQNEPFSPAETACFFEGLLPEGFTRRALSAQVHLDEADYVSLLAYLGDECLGAIRVTDGEKEQNAGYRRLTRKELLRLAEDGAASASEFAANSRLSLTGASGKTGLYYDEVKGVWYLPRGSAPSTHIVKQSHIRLDAIVTNEQICQKTAEKLGIAVPESFIVRLDENDADDEAVLFATKRYDREIPSEERKTIDGLSCPLRLHQEDFAQALGIPTAEKYETPNGNYLKKMFGLLRNVSADPIADQMALWDRVVFCRLIGNTDFHIKNASLLYDSNLQSVRLAPAYDLVSTAIYESHTREMAMRIGGVSDIRKISENTFQDAASEVGIGKKMAMEHFDDLCIRFENALTESARELAAQGFSDALQMRERILRGAGAI